MKKNMGGIDKVIRVLIAIIFFLLYFTEIVSGAFGGVLVALGAVFVITSLVGTCPLYLPFGINTCKKKQLVIQGLNFRLIYLINKRNRLILIAFFFSNLSRLRGLSLSKCNEIYFIEIILLIVFRYYIINDKREDRLSSILSLGRKGLFLILIVY